ncbi:MAG TPA: hypothetical protein VMS55_22240 [Myxococcota bacterium]|nr:hypothetical protein [Myxococcota bacterium]
MLLAAALLAFAPLASAQTATNDILGPCADDAARLCASVAAGHGAKMKCLSEHEAELGPECKERMTAVKARMKELADEVENLCGGDGKRLCPDRTLGSGLLPCLAEHEKDLSQPCRDWLDAHRGHGGAAP